MEFLKQQDEQIERMTGYLRDMEYRVKNNGEFIR